MGFNDAAVLRQRGEILERSHGIHQVIEDAQKEHDIELSDSVGGEVGDVDVEFFDLEIERGSRQIESDPAVDFRGPAVGVCCQDPCRKPPVGLEAEVTILGANIQDRLASKVQRAEDRLCFGAEHIRRLAARGYEPIPQIDGVKPKVVPDLREQLRGGSGEWLLAARRLPDGGVVRDISPSENPLHMRLQLRHRLALSPLGAVFTGAFRVLDTRPQYTRTWTKAILPRPALGRAAPGA
jgi:hypothetical protein